MKTKNPKVNQMFSVAKESYFYVQRRDTKLINRKIKINLKTKYCCQ